LCSENKKPKTKIKISFRIRKYGIENNTFQKSRSERDYCVSEKGVWNVFLYMYPFLRAFSSYLLKLGAVMWCRKQKSNVNPSLILLAHLQTCFNIAQISNKK